MKWYRNVGSALLTAGAALVGMGAATISRAGSPAMAAALVAIALLGGISLGLAALFWGVYLQERRQADAIIAERRRAMARRNLNIRGFHRAPSS